MCCVILGTKLCVMKVKQLCNEYIVRKTIMY